MKASILAFAVGGVVASTVVWLWPAPEPEVVLSAPGEPVVVRPLGTCPAEVERFRDVGDLQQTLAEAEAELAVALAQEELATGAPLEWPEDVPEGVDEASVEQGLAAIAEEFGGEVVGIDCGEYPCVAVLAWHGAHYEAVREAQAAMRERWPGSIQGSSMAFMGSDEDIAGQAVSMALLPEGELSDEATERVRFRAMESSEIFNPRDVIYPDGFPVPP